MYPPRLCDESVQRRGGAAFAADDRGIPRISAFYGIVIAMYYREHEPPHFHARYGEYEAEVAISTLDVMRGSLPAHALRLIRVWGAIHRDELEDNWVKARAHQPLDTIEPLR